MIWRRQRQRPSRERISTYGKAIRVAHEAYYSTGTTNYEELLRRVVSVGGVKGLLKAAETPKGGTRPRRIMIDRPDALALVVLRPDGTSCVVPAEIAHRVLIEMGELQ